MTLHEAAEPLGLTVRQVRSLVEAGLITAICVSAAVGPLPLVSLAVAGGLR